MARSLKILFFLFVFFSFANFSFANSPNLYFSNPPRQVEVGDRLTIDLKVNSKDQSINAITGAVSFPLELVDVASISKTKSIMNFWTQDPKVLRNKIVFEGIILNPGFEGNNGVLFSITFTAKQSGTVSLRYTDGGVLANDGYGTNLLTTLSGINFKIVPSTLRDIKEGETLITEISNKKIVALPVIVEYSESVNANHKVFIRGKGEPNSLTKIVFKDISVKSLGEQLVSVFQSKRKKLDEALVKNNSDGAFEYISNSNLLAGVYNATPFLVDEDTNTEKPGFGVQLLVSDSKIVKGLVVAINVLGLFIPIVALCVIIYFIPWYSWKRMRVLRKKLGLEEEKLEVSAHQLERQEKVIDNTLNKMTEKK